MTWALGYSSLRLAVAVVFLPAVLAGAEEGAISGTILNPRLDEVLSGKLKTPFQPEYDRHLDRVMMSVHNIADKEWSEVNFRSLDLLPNYSSVVLLVHNKCSAATLERSQAAIATRIGTGSKIVRSAILERWAQDIGEGGAEGFMLGAKGGEVLGSLVELGIPAHRHFLPLDGGNVQLARNRSGRRFVVLGSSEFNRSVDLFLDNQWGAQSRESAREAYLKTFGGEDLIVLPNLLEAHIDQSVLFLGDGLVATETMPEPVGDERRMFINFKAEWANASSSGATSPVSLYTAEYKGDTRRVTYNATKSVFGEVVPTQFMTAEQKEVFQRYQLRCPHLYDLVHADQIRFNRLAIERLLVERGFEIVRLKTSVWHELNCQNFVNGMAFRNRETGRPSVLLPVYRRPGAVGQAVDTANLQGLNLENAEILKARGFDVIPVPSHLGLGGNLHCSILQF